MGKRKCKISRWVVALLATVLVLASLIGCGSTASEMSTTASQTAATIEVTTAAQEKATEAAAQVTETESIAESIKESESQSIETTAAEVDSTDATGELTVEEDGHYTSKEEVALYIHIYGKLPSNFISKDEAEDLGWKKKDGEAGQLHVVAPGMSIGGSYFGNYEGLLPEKKGHKYYECDINYVKGNRGAERIVYSNDGLIFYTGDHYESFEQLY